MQTAVEIDDALKALKYWERNDLEKEMRLNSDSVSCLIYAGRDDDRKVFYTTEYIYFFMSCQGEEWVECISRHPPGDKAPDRE